MLSNDESTVLIEACALVVTAVHSHPGLNLPPAMQTVLCQLFTGLRSSSKQPRSAQG